MSNKVPTKAQPDLPISILSKLAGAQNPLLPGESAEEFSQGLQATIAELEARTPLQVYLAEKIFDCMWWARRLEAQKISIITNRMWYLLKVQVRMLPNRSVLSDAKWEDPLLVSAAAEIDHTVESLIAFSIKQEQEALKNIDARIADRIKAMQGLQSSYESLVNRKLVIERLRLQNQSLQRDLAAIEGRPVGDADR